MNSIIIYRNPLEQWFWEGDGAVALLVSMLLVAGYMKLKVWLINRKVKK